MEIVVYLIYKIIFMNLSKLHLIHLLIVFVLFYIHSNNFFFHDHGMYNFIFFFFLLFVNLFLILLLKAIIYIIKIKEKINNFLKVSYICLLILIYYYKFPNIGCGNEWVKGLNGTSIENDERKYGCQIKIPKYCQYKLLSPFFDFTKIFHINCSHKKFNSRKIILKYSNSPYINKKTRKFGFPYTNYGFAGCVDGIDRKIIKGYVQRNIFDVENNYKNFSKPEIIVDFSKDQLGELSIDVKFNESLSKERKELESKNSPYSNNIIIIYMDSVSRAHSMRQLNKTLSFFESFMSYEGGFNQKFPEEKYHSFQFFKYYAFLEQTSGNWPIIFYGLKKGSQNKILMTKFFKEKGYVTSNANDFCDKENTRTYHNLTEEEIYDHQFINCDPNQAGISSVTMRCLYGKPDIEQFLDYTDQFWRKYSNNRKFSTVITNHGHEGSLNVVKYIDDSIFNFLNNLFNDNLLKDTTVLLLSDHGSGMPSIYHFSDFYKIEEGLPMLYIIVNDQKNISYNQQYQYINENQQMLINAFDIYNTIGHIIYGDKYKNIKNKTSKKDTHKSEYGTSLFEKIKDGKKRTSKKYSKIERVNNICG